MGYALIILLVLAYLAVVWLRCHPEKVQMWVARRMMRHMQAQARRQQAQAEAEQSARQETYERARRQQQQQRRRRSSGSRREHIIPPEYAEDVSFTEIRSYSSDTSVGAHVEAPDTSARVQVEEQVSDVEWTDILPDGRSGKRHKVK